MREAGKLVAHLGIYKRARRGAITTVFHREKSWKNRERELSWTVISAPNDAPKRVAHVC